MSKMPLPKRMTRTLPKKIRTSDFTKKHARYQKLGKRRSILIYSYDELMDDLRVRGEMPAMGTGPWILDYVEHWTFRKETVVVFEFNDTRHKGKRVGRRFRFDGAARFVEATDEVVFNG